MMVGSSTIDIKLPIISSLVEVARAKERPTKKASSKVEAIVALHISAHLSTTNAFQEVVSIRAFKVILAIAPAGASVSIGASEASCLQWLPLR